MGISLKDRYVSEIFASARPHFLLTRIKDPNNGSKFSQYRSDFNREIIEGKCWHYILGPLDKGVELNDVACETCSEINLHPKLRENYLGEILKQIIHDNFEANKYTEDYLNTISIHTTLGDIEFLVPIPDLKGIAVMYQWRKKPSMVRFMDDYKTFKKYTSLSRQLHKTDQKIDTNDISLIRDLLFNRNPKPYS